MQITTCSVLVSQTVITRKITRASQFCSYIGLECIEHVMGFLCTLFSMWKVSAIVGHMWFYATRNKNVVVFGISCHFS